MPPGYGDVFLCRECWLDAKNWDGGDYQECEESQQAETVCFTPIEKEGRAA